MLCNSVRMEACQVLWCSSETPLGYSTSSQSHTFKKNLHPEQLSENVNSKNATLSFDTSLATLFNQPHTQILYDFELATHPCL